MILRILLLPALLALLAGCASVKGPETLTFVVLGDNGGGDESGAQPAAFHDLVREVAALRPAAVWNAGDMIRGGTDDPQCARAQWTRYREAIAPLAVPVHHVPGEQDRWDRVSGELYREFCGTAPAVADFGHVRFVGLDSETERNKVGTGQLEWLTKVLEESAGRLVFVVLHRPPFPVARAVGASLDAFPADRAELLRLFAQYADRIVAVFSGHERLYHHEERDGIDYYITGGGGAELHVPPERGGFHHYLLVQVTGNETRIELRKTGVGHLPPAAAPRRVAPGELLESWEAGLVWRCWDHSVVSERSEERALEGVGACQLNIDFGRYTSPTISASPEWTASQAPLAWTLDVFVPVDAPAELAVTAGAGGTGLYEAPAVALKPGWNRVRTVADTEWLPVSERIGVRTLQWAFTAPPARWRGCLLVDRLVIEPATGGDPIELEGWEGPFTWSVWNESVSTRLAPVDVTHGRRALQVRYPFTSCRDPFLIGKADPALDLRGVAALEVSVRATSLRPRVSWVIRSGEEDYASPPLTLKPGTNRMTLPLGEDWLPAQARGRVEQIAWRIQPSGSETGGELVFDELRAVGIPGKL